MNTLKNLNRTIDEQRERIIYSLNICDIQTVANEELERDLTDEEIKLVEDKVGDYIDWYEAIYFAIKEITR